jgi:hypothetical protein
MKSVMVRYKTTKEHAKKNIELVHAVFNQLRAGAPGGIRYSTFHLDDGQTFIHVATVESLDENPLVKLAAFKEFQKQLKDRCIEPPVVTEMSPVDSYVG